MIDPADIEGAEEYVAQRLAGALMAPARITRALVQPTPRAERLLDLLFRAHDMRSQPDSLGAEFVRAWLTYYQPGEHFVSSALINRQRPRERLDGVVDRICADSTSRVGKTRALGRFLRSNAGFSFGGFHIEEAGESRGAIIWTISEETPE